MQRKQLFVFLAAGLGLAGAAAVAANLAQRAAPAPVQQQDPAARAASPPGTTAATQVVAPRGANTAKPDEISDATLGDADSFGRNVRWLGLAGAYVQASTDCPSILADDPAALCQQINDLAATTAFSFTDIARIQLPAKASNSLFCHWFSPRVSVYFQNPTGSPVPARFSYNPTLTVENPVLDDPALIDPTTGAAFGGKLTTSMSASESIQFALDPGIPTHQNLRDSVVCQDGLVSKRSLVQTYGLTPAQASKFFSKPTTIRLNVSGNSRFADYAFFSLGLRIVGD